MDKRRKAPDLSHERKLRQEIYDAMAAGRMSVGQAVAAMRRISRLTQPEFAKHRGLSVQSLRLIESDKTNPTIDTLGKIASIFGLQVGFVPKTGSSISWQQLENDLSEPTKQSPLSTSIEHRE